jgi:two-component system, cell cycle sensor histidine kinase and response regulator CckA
MIVVVDDDDRIRSMTASALRERGFDVQDFDSGAAALAAMTDMRVEIILSDVQMPGMSGPEFVAAALHVQPDVKVHYMSGDVGDVTPEMLAPWPLLSKPFTVTALMRSIEALGVPL